jgi:hypothetical protein
MSAPDRSPDPTAISVEVHRHPTRNHRHALPLLRAQQYCLFTLLSAKYCCVTKEAPQRCTLLNQGNLIHVTILKNLSDSGLYPIQ